MNIFKKGFLCLAILVILLPMSYSLTVSIQEIDSYYIQIYGDSEFNDTSIMLIDIEGDSFYEFTDSNGIYNISYFFPEYTITGSKLVSVMALGDLGPVMQNITYGFQGKTMISLNISKVIPITYHTVNGSGLNLPILVSNTGANSATGINISTTFQNETRTEDISSLPYTTSFSFEIPTNSQDRNENITTTVQWINDDGSSDEVTQITSINILSSAHFTVSWSYENLFSYNGASVVYFFNVTSDGGKDLDLVFTSNSSWIEFGDDFANMTHDEKREFNLTVNIPNIIEPGNYSFIASVISDHREDIEFYIDINSPNVYFELENLSADISVSLNNSFNISLINDGAYEKMVEMTLDCPSGWLCFLKPNKFDMDGNSTKIVTLDVVSNDPETVLRKEVILGFRTTTGQTDSLNISFNIEQISPEIITSNLKNVIENVWSGYFFVSGGDLLHKPDFSLTEIMPRFKRRSAVSTWVASIDLIKSKGLGDICTVSLWLNNETYDMTTINPTRPLISKTMNDEVYMYYQFLKPGICNIFLDVGGSKIEDYIVIQFVEQTTEAGTINQVLAGQQSMSSDFITRFDTAIEMAMYAGMIIMGALILIIIKNARTDATPKAHPQEKPKEFIIKRAEELPDDKPPVPKANNNPSLVERVLRKARGGKN